MDIGLLHSVVNRVDELVPRGLKRVVKKLAPGVVRWFYGSLQSATPADLQQIRIQGGPLKGRSFTCSLRFERPYFVGNWEPEVAETLLRYLKPGDTFLDVGGHVGYMALVAAVAVGERGRVVTFEANADNARVIAANLAANPDLAPRIDIEQLAAWDATGTAAFEGSAGSTVGHVVEQDAGTEVVRTARLDEFVAAHGLDCTFVKMDIEGGEVRALPGMTGLLASKRPVVLVEIHDEAGFDVLLSLADANDYRLTTLSGPSGHVRSSWHGRTQYIALPAERPDAVKER